MTLQVLNPVAPSAGATSSITLVPSLAGSRIGLIGNGWPSWKTLCEEVERRLADDHEPASVAAWNVPLGSPAPDEMLDEIVTGCDAIVMGLGNCGSCTVATVQNAAYVAGRGVPVVIALTERFVGLASTLSAGLPLVCLPATLEQMSAAELEQVAAGLVDELAARLTEEGTR